ncbi:MAG TPA: hypothetical protein VFJ16_11455, partial [Longimicrobium sp.]|nr:hypothetical protein [Longimicrobium sp.]
MYVPDDVLSEAPARFRPLSDYGYVTADGQPVSTDRDTLLEAALSRPPPRGVWTPESGGVVEPYQVPWIFERLIAPAREKAWEQVKATGFLAALATLVGGLGWLQQPAASRGGPPLLLLVAVIWFGRSLLDYRQVRRITAAEFAAEVDEARRLPRGRAGVPVFTRAVAAIIGVVALAQLALPNDLESAALVK